MTTSGINNHSNSNDHGNNHSNSNGHGNNHSNSNGHGRNHGNSRISVNGLSFHIRTLGSGPPLLLLHGFMGSAADWRPHLPGLAEHYRVLAVDLIGHGQSAAPADWQRYTLAHCTADLSALLDELDIARTAVLGYSMGGRAALQLAAAAPARVSALIIESSTPGLADPAVRAQRRRADAALAAALVANGIEEFVHYWEGLPLFASQQRMPPAIRSRQRARRYQNHPAALAASLRGMGTGCMEPLHGRLDRLTMPTLMMTGELDQKYGAIARATVAALPRATLAVVPDAGHNVHLEQPELFNRLVLEFLQRHYHDGITPGKAGSDDHEMGTNTGV